MDNGKGFFQVFVTPLGSMLVVEQGGELVRVNFLEGVNSLNPGTLTEGFKESGTSLLRRTKIQMEEYFDGLRTRFDLPYKLNGTAFQLRTWNALRKIPYGETWSYQKQASQMGNATAARAVGQANGRNPLTILLPCHRVVGKNGTLTGYGGGIDRKQGLLDLENRFSRERTHWS